MTDLPTGDNQDRITALEIEVRSLDARVKSLEELIRLKADDKTLDAVYQVIASKFLTDGKGMD